MTVVKEIAGLICDKLDNPGREIFSPEKDAFMAALEAIAFYRHQLGNSGRFLAGTYFDVTPATQIFDISGQQGFIEAERVERLVLDTTFPSQYDPVLVVGVEDIEHQADIGEYAIAFFDTPMRAKLSWDPAIEIWNTLRIWYDATGVEPTTKDDDIGFPLPLVKWMLACHGAIMSLPKLNLRAPDRYSVATIQSMGTALGAQLRQYVTEWDQWRFDEGQEGCFQIERNDADRYAFPRTGFR